MLRHLGRTLTEAIAESSDAHRALRRIQEEGYSLYLLLDRQGLAEEGCAAPEPPRWHEDRVSEGLLGAAEPQDDPCSSAPSCEPRSPEREPEFRIDGRDLAFLRSIGIDPTRRVRRAKGRR